MTPQEIEKLKAELAAKTAEAAEVKAVNEALTAQVKSATETAKAGGVKTKKVGTVTYKILYPAVNHKGTVITADEIAKETNEETLAEYIEFGILVK